jgi:hypothetical protein
MKKFQCVVCQYVYEKIHQAAELNLGMTDRCICKTCSKLILEGLKEVKKNERT